jgi:ABC-type lipoprotein release transport system permease subunit
MIQLFKMAFRDLGRNKRRTVFSSLALGLGLACLLLMSAVLQGEMRDSMNLTIKLESGHLQVRDKSYEADQTSLKWEDLIENPAEVALKIAALEPVVYATPKLFASGIVTSGDEYTGVRVIGIDSTSEAYAMFKEGMVSGEFPAADDREGLVIGKRLADNLNLDTGDVLNLMVNTSNGDVVEQPFTVRGIFAIQTPAYDDGVVFLPLAKAQAITQAENRASAIFVLLHEREQTESVAAALTTDTLKIVTWREANQLFVMLEEYSNSYLMILYVIVLAITVTVIVNTLVMAVFERTREIGILASMGMKSGRIMAMFFAESSLLAVGGIIIGLIIGGLMVYYFATVGLYIGDMEITGTLFRDRIYAYPTIGDSVRLSFTALVVTLLAALYPAWLAAHMEPVDALRGGK